MSDSDSQDACDEAGWEDESGYKELPRRHAGVSLADMLKGEETSGDAGAIEARYASPETMEAIAEAQAMGESQKDLAMAQASEEQQLHAVLPQVQTGNFLDDANDVEGVMMVHRHFASQLLNSHNTLHAYLSSCQEMEVDPKDRQYVAVWQAADKVIHYAGKLREEYADYIKTGQITQHDVEKVLPKLEARLREMVKAAAPYST